MRESLGLIQAMIDIIKKDIEEDLFVVKTTLAIAGILVLLNLFWTCL